MNSLNISAEDKKCAYFGDKTTVPSQDELSNIRQNFLIQSARYLGVDLADADMVAVINMGKGPASNSEWPNDYRIM